MNIKYSVISLILLAVIGSYFYYNREDKPIIRGVYTQLTVLNRLEDQVITKITDQKMIERVMIQINNAQREDATSIQFEHGPEGTLIFEGELGTKEIDFFIDSGSVLTEKYWIHASLMFESVMYDGE